MRQSDGRTVGRSGGGAVGLAYGLTVGLWLLVAGPAMGQWPRPVTTTGTVTTNDVVVFADETGKSIKSGGTITTNGGRPGYLNFLIIPTNAVWEFSWAGPFREALTLGECYAITDASTCTVDVVEINKTNAWRSGYATNLSLVGTTSSATGTNFSDATIGIGNKVGVKIRQYNAGCSNVQVMIFYTF